MKIGPINFPDDLIRAIRRDGLVVFAGAGVSMGVPAKLPNFSGLTKNIARETGAERADSEPDDRFLGRLHKKGLPVHSLVEKALYTAPGSATPLHHNLLRLFNSPQKVRIVTTNFDSLFEEASTTVFGESTVVYRSPALPLGHDFTGIVHVHGSCGKPTEMVLTDADFGRAYLTEGWARRFLLAMFRKYTVLFVGYSHDDVVMHYLSRALPPEDTARFALVADDTNVDEWLFRGIRPLPFKKPSEDDYSILDEGVQALADYVSQNLLDRRKSLVAIASGMPPSDDETVDQILDALSEESTTRFVLRAARNPAWVRWFDSRKLLDSLFEETILTAIDKQLAEWLVDNFALEHHRELIFLISRHRMNIGSWLWYLLGREIGLNKNIEIDRLTLSTWVSLLLGTMPKIADQHILLWIAERCADIGDVNGILTVFGRMISHRLEVKEGIVWPDEKTYDSDKMKFDVEFSAPCDHWNLNEIYTKYIKPSLNQFALPVLSISITELEAQHATLVSWGESDISWDSSSFHRSAIEPHEQDRLHKPIDVLIDAVRDSLVTIGESNPSLSDSWLDTLSKSGAPLMRRIFIHGLNERRDKSADERLRFFLDRHGLHDVCAHHEISRLIADLYPGLNGDRRSELIDLILAYEWPDREDERFAELTARKYFDWLQCLTTADPSCKIANAAREKIVAEYPDFKPKKHPDLTHWMEIGHFEPRSPYPIAELLDKPASEWVEALLAFRGDGFRGPDRDGLRMTVCEAAKKNAGWGFDLATELRKRSRWDTDLWAGLLHAWEEWSADKNRCLLILGWLQTKELWEHNLYQITRTLSSLVRDGGKSCATTILGEANRTATVLWTEVEKDTDIPDSSNDWLQLAINKSSGVIAEFWLDSIELWRNVQSPKPDRLDDAYRSALNQILLGGTKACGLALTILASQLAFLLNVDYDWTKEHLLENFDSDNDPKRFQQSWHGFLISGTLNPQVVDEIEPYLEKSLNRLDHELVTRRDRFIEYFTALICFYVSDPLEKWVPIFFKNANPHDRKEFAMHIVHLLRGMNAEQQKDLWKRWIKPYWEKRLQGLPQPFLPEEIAEMAEWVPRLDTVFEQGVTLAVQMPPAKFEHSSIIYNLSKSDLVSQYPEATAILLVYLLKANSPVYFWHGLTEIMKTLNREKVSPLVLKELEILLAWKGFA
mgnify:CR=1 FL=1